MLDKSVDNTVEVEAEGSGSRPPLASLEFEASQSHMGHCLKNKVCVCEYTQVMSYKILEKLIKKYIGNTKTNQCQLPIPKQSLMSKYKNQTPKPQNLGIWVTVSTLGVSAAGVPPGPLSAACQPARGWNSSSFLWQHSSNPFPGKVHGLPSEEAGPASCLQLKLPTCPIGK